jgi:glucose/arabinose dehydrogenase
MPPPSFRLAVFCSVLAFSAACTRPPSATSASGGCDNSLELPAGFCAIVYSESAGPARDIAVRKNGDVIVGVLDQRRTAGGLLILRDTNRDGHADIEARAGDEGIHGVVLDGDSTLYASTKSAVLRFRFDSGMAPRKHVDTVITGLAVRPIPSHTLAVDTRGNLVVNIGALSNGCAAKEAPGVPGQDPCPELATDGGLWSFKVDRPKQTLATGTRIATGLHDAVALAVDPHDSTVYAVSQDRDRLHDLWPAQFSDEASATVAAEEMVRIATSRADFGWPYCYYDYLKQARVVAPEYAGDAKQAARCARLIQPLLAFPAHWSPMSMLFYTGTMFPAAYRTGAFVAFHGSADRAPLPEEGYQIAYVAFAHDDLVGDYSIFASGFAGASATPEGADHRAVGMAQGPDGALYVTDDKGGRIWKIVYRAAK